MRTKNFNLKKKIAFIASVTMIATTAAYLPAEVAQNIGIGSGIVASAATTPAAGQVDLFTAYIKVNGKYINKTTGATYNKVTDADKLDDLLTVEDSYLQQAANTSSKYDSDGKDVATYDDRFVAGTAAIALPTTVKPGSTILVEVVANTDDNPAAVTSSSNTVEATLDEYGIAEIAEKTKTIEVTGDNLTKDNDGNATGGDKETVDFSGLKFAIDSRKLLNIGTTTTSKAVKEAFTAANSAGTAIATEATSGAFKTVDAYPAPITDDTKAYDYPVVASGDVWARNVVATLAEVAEPGQEIVVDLKVNTNWTVKGTSVKDGKLTLKMGDNGVATSDVITFSKSGETDENYIVTIKNAGWTVDEANITLNNVGNLNSATALDTLKGATSTGGVLVKKDTTTANVDGTQFVDVYTVYSNAEKIAADGKVEITLNATASNAKNSKFEYVSDDGKIAYGTTTSSGSTVDDYTKLLITRKADEDFNYTTPVIKVFDKTDDTKVVGYVQFVFTNEYEIKLDDQNSNTKEDGTAKVVGTKVTAPADTHLGGYTFAGWKNGKSDSGLLAPGSSSSDKIVFTKGNTIQQSDAISPSTVLYAYYTANNYTVELDANGGEFGPVTGFTKTKVDDDNNTLVLSKAAEADSDSLSAYDAVKSAASRSGYTLKGWALTADATEDDVLDADTYDEAKPETTNGSLKLYAVWEANENAVSFKMFAKPDNDETLDATYSSATDANDANGKIADIKVVSGEAYGELPTPVLKGYKFVGWFKRDSGSATSTSDNKLVAVTASTKLEGTSDEIDAGKTLYAKFEQNTYSVTVDLDGGKVAENADIATFKIDYSGSSPAVKFFNAKDKEVTVTSAYKPTKGTGEYYDFVGWKINGSTQNYTSDKIATTILAMKEVGDVELKAVYKVIDGATSKGYIAIDANEGTIYKTTLTSGKVTKYEKADSTNSNYTKELTGFSGAKNTALAETVEDNVITIPTSASATNAGTYTVARPGYTFTGWYSDADCTTAYTFDKYPDGKEVTVYAGWKANASTRYKIHFNLVNANGAFVTAKDFDANNDADANEFSYTQTYMATTGSTVKASDKEFTYDGKTYVYDPVLSAAYNTEDEVKAEYLDVADDVATANVNESAGLSAGKFIIDSDEYTTIQGFYVEKGSEHKELGTATNVTVKDGTVTWTAADNADHYRIQKTVNGKTYYGAKVTAAKATYTVPVEEHEIAVVAYNADESEKTVSTVVKVAASTKLGKATNVKCAEDGTVTFSAATGATKYQVAKIVNGKTYYSAKSDATSIKISPATEDYEVYVIAFDSTGKLSTHSETIKVPAAASNLEAVDDATITVDGEGKVTWTAAKGAVAYKVFKITKNSEGKEVTNWGSKVTTTSYTFKNLPTTDYKVYVAAIDANGNVKYSAKKKISSLPAATNVKLSSDKKTVSWTAPTGTNADKIVKYQVAKFDPDANKTNYSVKVDAPATSITMRNAAVAGTKIFVLAFDADGNSSYSASIDVK